MSRSRRKTPIFGMTVKETDKPFKILEHRRERRVAKIDANVNPKQFGNPYNSPKDGKHYWSCATAKDMRKWASLKSS